MGLTCTVWRLRPADVDHLVLHPAEIEPFLLGEPEGAPAPAKGGIGGWLKRLSPIQIDPPYEPRGPSKARGELDLDKSWNGLHFLFTGTESEGEEPGCFLLRGGADLGEDEIGNDIPRVLTPEQVKAFAAFLAPLSTEELSRRYDAKRMMALGIYPKIWDRTGEENDGLDYVLEFFVQLRDFVAAAAADGDALVVHVT
jgi:uncharacterized protein DUF1877